MEIPDLSSLFCFLTSCSKDCINILTQEGQSFPGELWSRGCAPAIHKLLWQAGECQSSCACHSVCGCTDSSCPSCRRWLFRNHRQSHLQGIYSPDATASSVSALSYAGLFLETRPERVKPGKTANHLGSGAAPRCSPALWKVMEKHSQREPRSASSTQ